jgi:sulfonate transport system permease protein
MKNSGFLEKKHFFSEFCLPVLFPVLVLFLWEQLSACGLINPAILPPPSRICGAFKSLVLNGQIFRHLRASVVRVLLGFMMGTVLGLVIGVIVGISHKIDRATTLIISVLRPIPMIALIPVFILLLGIDEPSKIAVITMGAFWPVFMNTIYGIKSVDKKLLELASALKKSRWYTLIRVVMPSALPPIFVGIRLGAGAAWACVVAAEMIAASSGLGFLVMFAREVSQTSVMFMGVLLIGLFGLFIDFIIQRIERQVLYWNYPQKKAR